MMAVRILTAVVQLEEMTGGWMVGGDMARLLLDELFMLLNEVFRL